VPTGGGRGRGLGVHWRGETRVRFFPGSVLDHVVWTIVKGAGVNEAGREALGSEPGQVSPVTQLDVAHFHITIRAETGQPVRVTKGGVGPKAGTTFEERQVRVAGQVRETVSVGGGRGREVMVFT